MDRIKQDLMVELIQLKKETARIKGRTQRMLDILGNDVEKESHKTFEEYLMKIKKLVEVGVINSSHFHWSKDGTLRIWAKGVWDAYADAVKPSYRSVNRKLVQNRFYELSDLTETGYLLVVNFAYGKGKYTRQRGYRIKNAHQNKLLADVFDCPDELKQDK